jgi:hypothetical protein
MFTYNYRIFDRFTRPVASLAVLADESPEWRPSSYGYDLFGCQMKLDFPVAKLLDYETDREELLRRDNVFAVVTAAHMDTRRTREDPPARYEAKWRLLRMLYDRGWDRRRIRSLFGILDWMMYLPPELDEKLINRLEEYEEEKKMPYVTRMERRARNEGHQEGWEEGREEGREEEAARVLRRQLSRRFGGVPQWAEEKLSSADAEQLEEWAEELVIANSLEDVFGKRD